MRIVKFILLGLILLGIVVLALANRDPVTVRLLPEGLAWLSPDAFLELPLFVVSLLSIVTGMVLGYLLEYVREHKHRRRAATKAREAAQLNREMEGLRRETRKPKDDVLALLGN